jgi:Fe-Mn family superoxide dismutase
MARAAGLKPLPYEEGALEPTLSRDSIRVHHGDLQAKYVRGWNEGIQRGPRTRTDYEDLTFNGAGVILHELYFDNLCPVGRSAPPSQAFVECVTRCFGSFQNMVDQMASIGTVIQGAGWVVLAWIPHFERMMILPVRNHQNGWVPGAVPLLVVDVWEHAYFLDYQAARDRYLQLIWHNVDWAVVSQRYGGV